MSVCRGEELLSVRGRDLSGLVGNGIRQAPWREEGRGGPVPQAGAVPMRAKDVGAKRFVRTR